MDDTPDPLIEERKQNAKAQPRGAGGKFAKKVVDSVPVPPLVSGADTKSSSDVPPLVSFKVTNPVTYLKLWWKKVIGNEGIDLRLKIKPLTAITIVILILGATFSVGFVTALLSRVPVIKEIVPKPTPISTPNPWKETAYTGLLKQSGSRFYLVTNGSEAITLEVPQNVDLLRYLGKRILAVGKYNASTGIMQVTDASDLEVLIQSAPVPTVSPTPN